MIDNGTINLSPQWLSGSRDLLFVSDRDSKFDIYHVALASSGKPAKPPLRVTAGLDVQGFSLSVDGSRLAFAEYNQRSNIYSIEIPGGDTPVSIAGAQPLTRVNQQIIGIAVSRDREWLAFQSNRGGLDDLYRMPLAGGPEELLTAGSENDDMMPAFSPDGSEIAFYKIRDGSRDLYVMSATGTRERQVTAGPAQDRYPDWSPDGNRLVFYSDRTGRDEVWTVARDRRDGDWGKPVQLTTEGGYYPRLSPLGDLVAYAGPNGLWLIAVTGGDARLLVGNLLDEPFPNWSPDGRIVYYKAGQRANFWAVPTGGGEPRQLVVGDDPSLTVVPRGVGHRR